MYEIHILTLRQLNCSLGHTQLREQKKSFSSEWKEYALHCTALHYTEYILWIHLNGMVLKFTNTSSAFQWKKIPLCVLACIYKNSQRKAHVEHEKGISF